MRYLSLKFIFAAIFCVVFTLPSYSWDDVGHKITGFIAWQRLSPQARENVIRILRAAPEDSQLATFYQVYGAEAEEVRRREYFMFVPTWADVVRDRTFSTRYRKYHKGNWHYDDTFWKQVNGNVEALTGFDEGGEAVPRMVEFDGVIRSPRSSDAEKAIAIAWLMHMGGDIHQPLHTSARVTESEPRGDQGGNLFQLTPAGTRREDQLNLHWFWDSIVDRNSPIGAGMCEREHIEATAKRMMKKHPFSSVQNSLALRNYAGWQKESFAYNNTDVFSADLTRNQMPSARYRRNAFRLAERQLAIAGYRLGETLNAVFSVPPPANN